LKRIITRPCICGLGDQQKTTDWTVVATLRFDLKSLWNLLKARVAMI
jgi:hypothetical protein